MLVSSDLNGNAGVSKLVSSDGNASEMVDSVAGEMKVIDENANKLL